MPFQSVRDESWLNLRGLPRTIDQGCIFFCPSIFRKAFVSFSKTQQVGKRNGNK